MRAREVDFCTTSSSELKFSGFFWFDVILGHLEDRSHHVRYIEGLVEITSSLDLFLCGESPEQEAQVPSPIQGVMHSVDKNLPLLLSVVDAAPQGMVDSPRKGVDLKN